MNGFMERVFMILVLRSFSELCRMNNVTSFVISFLFKMRDLYEFPCFLQNRMLDFCESPCFFENPNTPLGIRK